MLNFYFILFFVIFFNNFIFGQGDIKKMSKDEKYFWERVHSKDRLKIIEMETCVTGVVEGVKSCVDGDYHIRLKLDKEYEWMINRKNKKREDGCMVLEIVCGKRSLFSICRGYENGIKLPEIGSKVKVYGSYVLDRRHGHMEIHPVFKIENFD
jgi:hypothetical protein